ncbi:hypothetical protein BaRGS_00032567 [Batillaria attramentaria]|uniref:Uncharacterized protein n=1 Tax=Batillaria attramentaria TaxID=370345 RepID=A0ABD0JMD9_9CAEN
MVNTFGPIPPDDFTGNELPSVHLAQLHLSLIFVCSQQTKVFVKSHVILTGAIRLLVVSLRIKRSELFYVSLLFNFVACSPSSSENPASAADRDAGRIPKRPQPSFKFIFCSSFLLDARWSGSNRARDWWSEMSTIAMLEVGQKKPALYREARGGSRVDRCR